MFRRRIDSVADNSDKNVNSKLNELNRITGKNYTGIEFAEYWGWTDLNTLAEKVLIPEPPCVRDLTKGEIKEIVTIIKASFISDDEETITNNLLLASSSSVIAL